MSKPACVFCKLLQGIGFQWWIFTSKGSSGWLLGCLIALGDRVLWWTWAHKTLREKAGCVLQCISSSAALARVRVLTLVSQVSCWGRACARYVLQLCWRGPCAVSSCPSLLCNSSFACWVLISGICNRTTLWITGNKFGRYPVTLGQCFLKKKIFQKN